jgi:hypothetical protein
MIGHHFHLDKLFPTSQWLQEERFQPALFGRYQHIPSIFGADDHVMLAGISAIPMGFDFVSYRTNVLYSARFVKGI